MIHLYFDTFFIGHYKRSLISVMVISKKKKCKEENITSLLYRNSIYLKEEKVIFINRDHNIHKCTVINNKY